MSYYLFAIAISVDYISLNVSCRPHVVWPVKVDMAVKMVAGLKYLKEPTESLDSPVSEIWFIVDLPGWGMRDEDVQEPPVGKPVHQHTRDKAKNMPPHFSLGVLERSSIIAKAALDPSHEYSFKIYRPPMDVNPPKRRAARPGFCVFD
jgi:hypothetical protein